jgi:hypothetical protein
MRRPRDESDDRNGPRFRRGAGALALWILSLAFTPAAGATETPDAPPVVLGAFSTPVSPNLLQVAIELGDYFDRGALGRGDTLRAVFRELFRQPVSYFDHRVLRDRAAEVIRAVWVDRILLRQALARVAPEDTSAVRCANAARDLLRALRYIEDYTAELTYRPHPPGPRGQFVLRGDFPELLVHPKFGTFDRDTSLRAGDLLLSRGAAFTSATVARLADVPSQFSHVAIVAIDSVAGRCVVHARMEQGVVVVPIETFLAGDMTRVVVLRHPDQALSARAARLILAAASSTGSRRRQIPYDFELRDDDASQLYCAEVASRAFALASNGAVQMPRFRSTLDQLKPGFRKRLGIRTTRAFLPGDLEVDPQFEVVAEWRDLARTRENRRLDLVLTRMMQWMWDSNYTLRGTAASFVGEWIVFPMRHTPVLRRPLSRLMARNMPRGLLGTILELRGLVNHLEEVAAALDAAGAERTGYPLSPGEIYAGLEDFRVRDLEQYRRYRNCRSGSAPSHAGYGIPCTEALPINHLHFRPRDHD